MNSESLASCGHEGRLDTAIAEFLRAEAVGEAGDRQQWLDRYPECAVRLQEFFDDREHFGRAIMPLRLEVPAQAANRSGQAGDELHDAISGLDTVDLRPEPPKLSSDRYRPVRFHAGGGMGEIWLAQDEKIGRQVALKKLKTSRDTENLRFFVEAQITGQLEHPNIVPLHDLGFDDRGCPYYVMKFIRGRRLREAITQFHTRDLVGDWSEDVEFRRLLEVLVSVCNVVAFAHSKGVLHRDIKPDNVMLGPFGETLVVDWGLAKVIGQAEAPRASGVYLSTSGSTATQDGAIVGSPYYMSPEGAEGHPEAVDQTSDVYLLGATLYEVLTNRPPRHGSSNWELIDLARHSRPTNPRSVNGHIPRAIEAICLKAMSFRKQDRYATPLDLAADVERYLAGAPVAAYREPLSKRAWRWVLRHRRGIMRAAVAVSFLLVSCAAIHSYREAGLLAAREQARGELAEFERLADEAQFYAANTDAPGERVPLYDPQRADEVGSAALAIAENWGADAQSLPLADERERVCELRQSLLLTMAQSQLAGKSTATDPRRALELLKLSKAHGSKSSSSWLLSGRAHRLLGNLQEAKRDEARAEEVDMPLSARDLFQQGELLRLEDIGTVAAEGETSTSNREHLQYAMDKYQQAIELDPQHFWARYQLGRSLLALDRLPEAIQTLSGCIAVKPAAPWSYSSRGMAYALAGNREAALADLNRAMALAPDFAPAQLNRGFVQAWLFDDDKAALADFAALLDAPEDERLTEAAFYRGQLQFKRGRLQEAIADFDTIIASKPTFRPAYWERARAKCQAGLVTEGISDVERYLELSSAIQPSSAADNWRFELGKSLRVLGQQLHSDASRRVLSKAATEMKASLSATPSDAARWEQFGSVQILLGEPAAAVTAFSRGLEIAPNDVALLNQRGWARVTLNELEAALGDFAKGISIDPQNVEAYTGRGFVLAELGKTDEARADALLASLIGADNPLALHNLACLFGRLSTRERRRANEDLALAALDRATAISKRMKPGTPDALELLRAETSFPESLKERQEFQKLLEAD